MIKTMKIWKNLSNDVAQNLKIIKSRKLNLKKKLVENLNMLSIFLKMIK